METINVISESHHGEQTIFCSGRWSCLFGLFNFRQSTGPEICLDEECRERKCDGLVM